MLVQLPNDWLCLDVYSPSVDSCHLLCPSPRHDAASDSGLQLREPRRLAEINDDPEELRIGVNQLVDRRQWPQVADMRLKDAVADAAPVQIVERHSGMIEGGEEIGVPRLMSPVGVERDEPEVLYQGIHVLGRGSLDECVPFVRTQ